MALEGSTQPESLDDLRGKIIDMHKSEGFSDSFNTIKQEWVDKKREGGMVGGSSIEDRLNIELEIVELYIELGYETQDIIEELDSIITQAHDAGLETFAQNVIKKYFNESVPPGLV